MQGGVDQGSLFFLIYTSIYIYIFPLKYVIEGVDQAVISFRNRGIEKK